MKEEKNKKELDKEIDLDEKAANSHNTSASSSSDDIVMDEEEENTASLIKRLREKLALCQKEKQEYLLGWQRSKADFVNARKEFGAQMASLTSFAEIGLIEELLPVLDSFHAARKNKEAWEKAPKEWRVGIEYIEQKLVQTLKSHGLEIMDPLGEKFNHDEHEAIKETAEGEGGVITEVLQLGYKLKNKVIRAARVTVGK